MNLMPPHALSAFLVLVFTLVIASAIRVLLQRINSEKDYTELKLRIQSWWVMVLVFFVFALFNRSGLIILFGFLSFLALKEFFSIVPLRHSDRRVIFMAYLAIPIQYYWVGISWYGMFVVFIPVYMFLFLPMRMVLLGETKGFIRSTGVIQWGVMLTVFSLSHVPLLLTLPVKNFSAGAIGLVLYLLIMTELNDVSQYCWGKSVGRHKILPRVSPNKTWEGFLGGLGTIMVCSYFAAPFLTPLSPCQGLMSGGLIALSGFVGDTVVSAVKRDLEIKDSGTMIPGHGGILDRFDSLTFTAPMFFHLIYFLVY